MAKVKPGIFNMDIPQKITTGKRRATALADNDSVKTDPEKLSMYVNAVSGLENARAEVANTVITLSEKYSLQNVAEEEYNKQTIRMVNEINSITGEEISLVSTGFPIAGKVYNESGNVVPTPQTLIAKMGIKEGEVYIKWRSVKSAHSYNIEYSADPTFQDNITKRIHVGKITKNTITDLQPGTKIWFRVQAIKGTETSAWSDPSITMVP